MIPRLGERVLDFVILFGVNALEDYDELRWLDLVVVGWCKERLGGLAESREVADYRLGVYRVGDVAQVASVLLSRRLCGVLEHDVG